MELTRDWRNATGSTGIQLIKLNLKVVTIGVILPHFQALANGVVRKWGRTDLTGF